MRNYRKSEVKAGPSRTNTIQFIIVTGACALLKNEKTTEKKYSKHYVPVLLVKEGNCLQFVE